MLKQPQLFLSKGTHLMQPIKASKKHLVLRAEAIRVLGRAELAGAVGGSAAPITTLTEGKVTSAACQ